VGVGVNGTSVGGMGDMVQGTLREYQIWWGWGSVELDGLGPPGVVRLGHLGPTQQQWSVSLGLI
jgi:hypothetical protein